MTRRSARDAWTPPGRSPRERRNAHVKVAGAVLIVLALIVLAVIAAL